MVENSKPFPSIDKFFFSTPLYTPVNMAENWGAAKHLFVSAANRIDGYCRDCHAPSTFRVMLPNKYSLGIELSHLEQLYRVDITLECQRQTYHNINYYLRKKGSTILKVGQYPSLADIALDESEKYRKVLKDTDAAEFHKAIGLAAHGVGIGSFVYLRRIFERLVASRFKEFKDVEQWKDDALIGLRMDERVKFLKDHLPSFLVENSHIYSILSRGIHELDETMCLHYFDVLKMSIETILDEDEQKRAQLERRTQMTKALASITQSARDTNVPPSSELSEESPG